MADVRGHGLLIGLEWVSDREQRTPDPAGTNVVVNRLKEKGFLVSRSGTLGNVLMLRPPVVFEREHAEQFLSAFEETVRDTQS